jgi:hypothetical protein
MTRLAAAHQLAAIHAADYSAKLKELEAQLVKINVDQNLTPAQKQTQAQSVQNQIAQVQGQQGATAIKDQTSIAQQTSQPWVHAANQVGDAWIQGFNKIIMGGQGAWRAMAKAEEQMVMSLIGDAEKWALHWVEKEVMTLVFHQTTEAQKAAATAAAQSSAVATSAASNAAMAMSNAGVAATGAAAAVAAIPIVGPALAPAAAASTLADLSGFIALASFDVGTSYVPKDGMAMIHRGETILPPPQADVLREALSGRGGQSGGPSGIQLHYAPTFQSGGTQADARQTVRDLGSMLRRMNLTTSPHHERETRKWQQQRSPNHQHNRYSICA